MDMEEEELRFLGFSRIYAESFKIISTWRKLFTQITLSLILPLSFIFLANSEISQVLFFNILRNEFYLTDTQEGTQRYARISDMITSEWIALCLFRAAYFTFTLILSLLSTSAVVYTIASIYAAQDVSFRKVMAVVPKVWKRLMVTFLWSFAIVFAYNLIFSLFFLLWLILIGPFSYGIAIFVILIGLYTVGFGYIAMIWQLASVVSVLEDAYGREAMAKSKALMKGKTGLAAACFLGIVVCFVLVQVLFELLVVIGLVWIMAVRVVIGVACLVLLVTVLLFGLVAQTVIYFVCKSYHRERIDKSLLADHLTMYFGEYVPLKAKDIQLEQLHV